MFLYRYAPLFILALLSFAIMACSSDDAVVVKQPEPAQEPDAPVGSNYTPGIPKQPEVPAAAPAAIVPDQPKPTVQPIVQQKEREVPKPETKPSIVIVDALGREVAFESVPEKIATISPTATEMLYVAGGESVLRDRASRYPAQAQKLPDVGSAYDPSLELLIDVSPELVIIEALTQAQFVPALEKSGFKVVSVKAESVEDVKSNISNIGKILGSDTIAQAFIDDMENRLASVGGDDGRSILILISDRDRNLYAARPESYTGLIASLIGLVNKAEGMPDFGPFPGFTAMSPELILAANPDIIVTITPAPEPAPRLSDTIKMIPPFAGLKAMRSGAIIEGDLTLFLQSPGPRIVEAVEFLKVSLDSIGR